MKIRLILNGSKRDRQDVQEAITWIRQHHFFALDVRYSESPEDFPLLVTDAVENGVERLIAGGGDGTLNLTVNALMAIPKEKRPELGIFPIGTANDFATAAFIPENPRQALITAIDCCSVPIDIGQVNERHFLNVASGGFGAVITAETPPELKQMLGGAAYLLTGVLKLFEFTPIQGKMCVGDQCFEGSAYAIAVCNARQAGGGMVLAPNAYVDDGQFDVVLYTLDSPPIPEDLAPPSSVLGWILPFKKIFRVQEVTFIPEEGVRQINLDGEPYEADRFEFRIHPQALNVVLPPNTPLLQEA
ncbi:lipid kinase YegS [Nitratifractor salsuginis]|uniref:Diacylglycerol kinase catalytic region n=1 Tax=Nitratifractor salsuginis (strain DSM 16511 / JCM 12458 / E9I37-1) TaxID=749222 RepID=E6X0N5_NITSE|nr:lipid kinase YegS [Nitratifractor salsuginis]ADV45755.1 diacylglycerol kinase catalytic region [Nitratifractor salsuginis DSM 16511]